MNISTAAAADAGPRSGWSPWALVLVFSVLSLGLSGPVMTPDVSWLTDMCARMLQGEKAYVDIFETTPPIPTLLYMPGVLIEQMTGLRAEYVITAYTHLASWAVLWLTWRILPRQIAHCGSSLWTVIIPAALFLLLISRDAFAQREYYSALFTLPVAAVFVRHIQTGNWASSGKRAAAALLCGLAVAIKPPVFALPVMLLAAWYMVSFRRLRFIWSSGLFAAGLVSIVLTAGSLALFPDYLGDMRTLMSDVYVPIRRPFPEAFGLVTMGVMFCLAVVLFAKYHLRLPPVIPVFAILAVGYQAVFVAQGKYFNYHVFPAALFAFLALVSVLYPFARSARGNLRRTRIFLSALCAFVPLFIMAGAFHENRPVLKDLSWAEDLDQPTAMSLSSYISIGFPLARQIEARWIDRIHSQWVSHYTNIALAQDGHSDDQRILFQSWQARDMDRTIDLLQREQPDIVIECTHSTCRWFTDKLRSLSPDLLVNYEVVAEENPFRIWRHRRHSARPLTDKDNAPASLPPAAQKTAGHEGGTAG